MEQLTEALSTTVHCKNSINASQWWQSAHSQARTPMWTQWMVQKWLGLIIDFKTGSKEDSPQNTQSTIMYSITKQHSQWLLYKGWETEKQYWHRVFWWALKKWNETFITIFYKFVESRDYLCIFVPSPCLDTRCSNICWHDYKFSSRWSHLIYWHLETKS